MPVQFRPSPPIILKSGIAPVMNTTARFGLFIDAGSIPAEPTRDPP